MRRAGLILIGALAGLLLAAAPAGSRVGANKPSTARLSRPLEAKGYDGSIHVDYLWTSGGPNGGAVDGAPRNFAMASFGWDETNGRVTAQTGEANFHYVANFSYCPRATHEMTGYGSMDAPDNELGGLYWLNGNHYVVRIPIGQATSVSVFDKRTDVSTCQNINTSSTSDVEPHWSAKAEGVAEENAHAVSGSVSNETCGPMYPEGFAPFVDEQCGVTVSWEFSRPGYTQAEKDALNKRSLDAGIAAAAAATAAAGLAVIPEPTLLTKVAAGGAAVFSGVAWLYNAVLARLAADPPDPHFRAVTRPRSLAVPALPPSLRAALLKYMRLEVRAVSVAGAMAISLDRASGAANAHQPDYVKMQRAWARRYARDLAAILIDEPAVGREAAKKLVQAHVNIGLTQAQVTQAQEDIVFARKLPASVLRVMEKLGATKVDLARAWQGTVDNNPARLGGGLADIIRTEATSPSTGRAVAALRRFAATGK